MKTNEQNQLKDLLSYFKKVSLFAELSEAQIKTIIEKMKKQKIAAGDFIIHEGDKENSLYILIKGEVEISKSLVLPQWIQSGQKQEKSLLRLSEKYHPFFGEMAMFSDQRERSASITAVTPCTIAVISLENLETIIEKDPVTGTIIYKNIASVLAARLIKANKDILKLTTAFTLALEG
jgi:CRP-like cAMP-binding protein